MAGLEQSDQGTENYDFVDEINVAHKNQIDETIYNQNLESSNSKITELEGQCKKLIKKEMYMEAFTIFEQLLLHKLQQFKQNYDLNEQSGAFSQGAYSAHSPVTAYVIEVSKRFN